MVWIGLPIVSSPTRDGRLRQDQRDRRKEAKRAGRRRRSSSTPTRCSPATTAASPSTSRTRRVTRSRCGPGDGVHFDTAGGDMIAREVLRQLNKVFDLTSWRQAEGRVTAYVALLRAVNVGGRNSVSMPKLREALAGRGLEDVSTVLQSGNVLFSLVEERGRRRRSSCRRRSRRPSGSTARVLVRSAAELKAVAAKNPFVRRGEDARPEDAPRRLPRAAAGEGRRREARPRPLPAGRLRRRVAARSTSATRTAPAARS